MVAFVLNGESVDVEVPENTTLLEMLSMDLNQYGPKFGCGLSQCGACTVLVDGDPVVSCETAATAVTGRSVETLAALRDGDMPGRLQQAFIDEQAAQCGYCTAGIIMRAQALLDQNPNPTESEVRTALNDNLCRCGSQARVIRAVMRAAG
jgi:aerobic-type carbon monoxide dehydrogenase small subunit (CoxS/CutS family)